MKHVFTTLALAACVSFSTYSLASERVEHFKGLPAPDLSTAVKNLSEYSDLLEKQLSAEITSNTLGEVHVLTYTLEIALEKINQELAQLADTLEEVHIASETNEPQAMADKGKEFLGVIEQLRQL